MMLIFSADTRWKAFTTKKTVTPFVESVKNTQLSGADSSGFRETIAKRQLVTITMLRNLGENNAWISIAPSTNMNIFRRDIECFGWLNHDNLYITQRQAAVFPSPDSFSA